MYFYINKNRKKIFLVYKGAHKSKVFIYSVKTEQIHNAFVGIYVHVQMQIFLEFGKFFFFFPFKFFPTTAVDLNIISKNLSSSAFRLKKPNLLPKSTALLSEDLVRGAGLLTNLSNGSTARLISVL